MNRKFNTCDYCGAHLDHGERCDCEKSRNKTSAPDNNFSKNNKERTKGNDRN